MPRKTTICMVLPHGRLRCRGSRIPECCLKILFLPLSSRKRKFFIGYRMQGVDVLDAEKMTVNQRIRKGLENVDVPSLLALQDGSVWAATYGRGFVRLKKGTLAYKLDREQMDNEVPFPRPAQMEEPSVVLRRLERLGSDAHAGKNIVFRGRTGLQKGTGAGSTGTRVPRCAPRMPP